MTRLRRWWGDLALGVRLVLGGGRTSGVRVLLVAVGVGLAVALLLGAASYEGATAGKQARDAAREPARVSNTASQSADTAALRYRDASLYLPQVNVNGLELAALRPDAPRPPGVDRAPQPGEMVVSPALGRLLADPSWASVRGAFPEKIVGEIGPAGLRAPTELYYYAGLPAAAVQDSQLASGFGQPALVRGVEPGERLLNGLVVVFLLVPIAMLVLVATRVAAPTRERRLAALRLLGGRRSQVHRIAAGEALVAAVAGVVVGGLLFVALRPLVELITIGELAFYATDVVPTAGLVVLVAVLVPAVAVAAAWLALRRVDRRPLGAVRGVPHRPRRLGWRLGLLGAGVALSLAPVAAPLVEALPLLVLAVPLVLLGVVLTLVAMVALLPWLVDSLSRRLRPPGVAAQLGVGRLRTDGGTDARVVTGLLAVLVTVLTLQVVLDTPGRSGGGTPFDPPAGPGESVLSVWLPARPLADVDGLRQALRDEPGVTAVHSVRRGNQLLSQTGELSEFGPLVVEIWPCEEILLRGAGSCEPGQAFALDAAAPTPGTRVQLSQHRFRPSTEPLPTMDWTVPPATALGTQPNVTTGLMLIAAGGPLDSQLPVSELSIRAAADPAVQHAVFAVTSNFDRSAYTNVVTGPDFAGDPSGAGAWSGWLAAIMVMATILVGLALLISTVDQTYERRRSMAALAAVGVPRRTLAGALMWQSAVPLAVAVAVALPASAGLGWLLSAAWSALGPSWSSSVPVVVPWSQWLLVAGVAVAMAALASLASMPTLRRATRPEALRFE